MARDATTENPKNKPTNQPSHNLVSQSHYHCCVYVCALNYSTQLIPNGGRRDGCPHARPGPAPPSVVVAVFVPLSSDGSEFRKTLHFFLPEVGSAVSWKKFSFIFFFVLTFLKIATK
uniref:(northern house mosquito) hypothetical protein n=1 Tax=Culex pipiens TaxID=7175 RepID=A0A8D8FGZ6_CULPI